MRTSLKLDNLYGASEQNPHSCITSQCLPFAGRGERTLWHSLLHYIPTSDSSCYDIFSHSLIIFTAASLHPSFVLVPLHHSSLLAHFSTAQLSNVITAADKTVQHSIQVQETIGAACSAHQLSLTVPSQLSKAYYRPCHKQNRHGFVVKVCQSRYSSCIFHCQESIAKDTSLDKVLFQVCDKTVISISGEEMVYQ